MLFVFYFVFICFSFFVALFILLFGFFLCCVFLCVFSLSGFLVSLSVFFLKGVEEVPFPEGAIIFHLDGIALSLLILFICSLPMILKINPNNSEDKSGHLKSNEVRSENLEIADSGNKSDEWEEASEEDLQSGNFETI